MPELAGRRVFYAALAVPIAMVIAPLTASAGEVGDTAVTEQAQPGAVATADEAALNAAGSGGISRGPDWYVADGADVVHSETEDTQVTYVVNGLYDESVVGNASEDTMVVENEDDGFSPGPDWWYDADVVHNESEDTQVTYVVNGIHDETVIGNASEDTTVVENEDDGFSPGPDWYDADVVHNESEDTQVTYVVNGIHKDSVIGNYASDNTYVSDGVDEVVHEDDGDGTEVEVTEVEVDDVEVDVESDDTTWTYFEELSAHAGEGGAHSHSIESGSFDND